MTTAAGSFSATSDVDARHSQGTSPEPQPMERLSVQEQGAVEASQFKWILSEQAGRDLGDEAIRRWVREHWNGFLRARWLEHLEGRTFWIELDHNDFGLLRRAFVDSRLLTPIIERLKVGWENLDIIQWSLDTGYDIDEVIAILHALDINSRRIEFHYGERLVRSGR